MGVGRRAHPSFVIAHQPSTINHQPSRSEEPMKNLKRTLFLLLVLLTAVYLVGPFMWLVGTSFMDEKEAQLGHWLPRRVTMANYRAFLAPDPKTAELGAATARKFVPGIGNSLVVAGWVTLCNLLLGS